MNTPRKGYTINPETGKEIKIGKSTWKRLAAKYYRVGDTFTDQPIPDIYDSESKQRTPLIRSNRTSDPKGEKQFLIVGSSTWNDRFLEYEWDGHEFGEKRHRRLPTYLNTVEKRRELRRNKAYERFDRKVSQGRLNDVIDSSLGYALTYYHTVQGDMYKEWVKEKRTKKDFRLNNDDENRLWVRLPGEKGDEEVEPINLIFDESEEFNETLKKFIINGMRKYNQCFITIMAYNLMWTHDGNSKILSLIDDRLGHLRIVRRDRIDEWIREYLKWYQTAVEDQETEGSGFRYVGWIGFHIEIFPLRTFVGNKQHTPYVIGRTAINPNIDDNRCLQRCLILASEGGHKIVASRKTDCASMYNKWWKHPEKNKVFGVTIHEIEEAMGIRDNTPFVGAAKLPRDAKGIPFDASEEKFATLEALLKVTLNVFEVTLLPGYNNKSEDQFDLFTCNIVYKGEGTKHPLSLCILNDLNQPEGTLKHFLYIKDLNDFKHRMTRRSDAKNENLSRNVKCRFCDEFYGSRKNVHNHEVQVHREQVDESEQYDLTPNETRLNFTNQRYEMPAPVVVYADFESAIDNNNRHKPIMLSCLAVSRIPTIETQLRIFHAPHESEEDLHPFMSYLTQLRESVKEYLFDKLPLENSPSIERDFRTTTICPFCHKQFDDILPKVRHHALMPGNYTTGRGDTCFFEAGQYICTCCINCEHQYSFNKKNYHLPVYFHNGSHYDFAFIMKIIASHSTSESSLEVIPTTEDKEMQIEYNGIQFKDSLKLISSPLRSIVAQTLGGNLDLYVHTKQQLCKYCESRGKQWKDEYIDLLTRKEPMFYSLIKSYDTLNNTTIPSREQCIDDMKGEIMPQDEYDHMMKLWNTFDIKTWGEYYELYNVLDVTLMADAFEHFRVTTLNAFGVDPMHYITAPQMAYSLFLKVTMKGDHSETSLMGLARKWAQYIMRINANEGLEEKQLVKVFMKRMGEFYESKGIRLMEENEIDDFMRLLKNLRGGITQIVKRYAKVDLANNNTTDNTDNNGEQSSIYYLDANNLYGGAMHRMMPYEIVGVPERQEVMERVNRDPNEWVQSLKTFNKYGFFIECDIEAPVELHDKFNDLPFFPEQKAGMYSDGIKKYAEKNDIVDKVKETKTKKLICDLAPRQKYLVHYSLLQLGIQQGYRVTHIHRLIRFKQAPFIFEYVNMLSEKRAKAKTTVEKNLYKLLANSTYGKFVETGLKRMKVKFASTWNEREAIIQKHGYDMIAGSTMYSENLIGIKLNTPVRKVEKPFFIGFAILDMSKHIIYDFYYNVLKTTFDRVELLGQDTDSLIVQLHDRGNIVGKICNMYKSFDFSELDNTSYFYGELVKYYEHEVDKKKFPSLESFLNFNKKLPGPIFKDEHNGHRITEFVGLRPKMYCLIDEKHVVHNAAKGVPRSVVIDGERMSVKNIELYKRVLQAQSKNDACIEGTFKRINNQAFNISTKEQTKTLMTCTDNKRWILDDNVHTLAFGHYRLK